MSNHTDRGVHPQHVARAFAKSEAAREDALTPRQRWLMKQDGERQKRHDAMSLAAIQKSRPSKPPRAPAT